MMLIRSLLLWTLALLGAGMLTSAQAAVRATLDRSEVHLGETVVLQVQTDADVDALPDLQALSVQFNVLDQSSETQATITGSGMRRTVTFRLELAPKVQGSLQIPPLQVGNERTEALALSVLPPRQSGPAGMDPVFLQAEVDTLNPYVQQPLRYTVRLYYAVQLINGGVDAPTTPHVTQVLLGEERNVQQQINGQLYNVFERQYLLTPERSGPVTLPAVQFRGRARRPGADPFFDRGSTVAVQGQPITLDVRPMPEPAPAPWLPAAALTLVRSGVPDQAQAGQPFTVELELSAEGALVSMLPALELAAPAGAQVFPEAATEIDGLPQGQVRGGLKRRFAVVPMQAGTLRLPAQRVTYWNTHLDRASVAEVPAIDIPVVAGSMPAPAPGPGESAAPLPGSLPGPHGQLQVLFWQLCSLTLLIALVAVAMWGWRRGPAVGVPAGAAIPAVDPPVLALEAALQRGDLAIIEAAVVRHPQPLTSAQQTAVAALRALRWAPAPASGAAADAVLTELRQAFARSAPAPRVATAEGILPPLYPPAAR